MPPADGIRILVIHPELTALGGGGCALTAYALQGLARHYAVDVLTRRPVDFASLDRMFGTRLVDATIENRVFAVASSLAWATAPALCERVRRAVTARECLRHAAERRYALLVSTNEEVDFGPLAPGVQYVNWPLTSRAIGASDVPWYHVSPALTALYRGAVGTIAPWDPARVGRNLTIANSEFSAAAVKSTYGVEPAILYPPVPGAFPDVPWEERRPSFVCLGRLSIHEKDLLKVVEIVARVRARGHDVGLDLVGTFVTRPDLERLRAEAGARGAWLAVHVNLPREALIKLVSSRRYGLHGNAGEHFGIAVAECLRAGMVPFAPTLGGCAEILGRDTRFLYASVDEAVERIAAPLENPAIESEMRAFTRARRDLFTVERFQDGLVAYVRCALEGGAAKLTQRAFLPDNPSRHD